MSDNEIRVNFIYESQKSDPITCKSNEKIIIIAQTYCLNKGIDFKKVYFLFNGQKF